MMKANRRASSNVPGYPVAMFIFAAVLLILLGVAFQVAEIGWSHVWPNNFWLFSVIVPGLWNMLAVQWNAPEWQELLRFWPLALVATGMAMLLAQKRAYARERSSERHDGGNSDE